MTSRIRQGGLNAYRNPACFYLKFKKSVFTRAISWTLIITFSNSQIGWTQDLYTPPKIVDQAHQRAFVTPQRIEELQKQQLIIVNRKQLIEDLRHTNFDDLGPAGEIDTASPEIGGAVDYSLVLPAGMGLTHFPQAVQDDYGNTIEYYETGLLKSVTAKDGEKVEYEYEIEDGKLKGIIKKEAGVIKRYDSSGDLVSVTDGLGSTIFYEGLQVTRVVDRDGNRTVYTYLEDGVSLTGAAADAKDRAQTDIGLAAERLKEELLQAGSLEEAIRLVENKKDIFDALVAEYADAEEVYELAGRVLEELIAEEVDQEEALAGAKEFLSLKEAARGGATGARKDRESEYRDTLKVLEEKGLAENKARVALATAVNNVLEKQALLEKATNDRVRKASEFEAALNLYKGKLAEEVTQAGKVSSIEAYMAALGNELNNIIIPAERSAGDAYDRAIEELSAREDKEAAQRLKADEARARAEAAGASLAAYETILAMAGQVYEDSLKTVKKTFGDDFEIDGTYALEARPGYAAPPDIHLLAEEFYSKPVNIDQFKSKAKELIAEWESQALARLNDDVSADRESIEKRKDEAMAGIDTARDDALRQLSDYLAQADARDSDTLSAYKDKAESGIDEAVEAGKASVDEKQGQELDALERYRLNERLKISQQRAMLLMQLDGTIRQFDQPGTLRSQEEERNGILKWEEDALADLKAYVSGRTGSIGNAKASAINASESTYLSELGKLGKYVKSEKDKISSQRTTLSDRKRWLETNGWEEVWYESYKDGCDTKTRRCSRWHWYTETPEYGQVLNKLKQLDTDESTLNQHETNETSRIIRERDSRNETALEKYRKDTADLEQYDIKKREEIFDTRTSFLAELEKKLKNLYTSPDTSVPDTSPYADIFSISYDNDGYAVSVTLAGQRSVLKSSAEKTKIGIAISEEQTYKDLLSSEVSSRTNIENQILSSRAELDRQIDSIKKDISDQRQATLGRIEANRLDALSKLKAQVDEAMAQLASQKTTLLKHKNDIENLSWVVEWQEQVSDGCGGVKTETRSETHYGTELPEYGQVVEALSRVTAAEKDLTDQENEARELIARQAAELKAQAETQEIEALALLEANRTSMLDDIAAQKALLYRQLDIELTQARDTVTKEKGLAMEKLIQDEERAGSIIKEREILILSSLVYKSLYNKARQQKESVERAASRAKYERSVEDGLLSFMAEATGSQQVLAEGRKEALDEARLRRTRAETELNAQKTVLASENSTLNTVKQKREELARDKDAKEVLLAGARRAEAEAGVALGEVVKDKEAKDRAHAASVTARQLAQLDADGREKALDEALTAEKEAIGAYNSALSNAIAQEGELIRISGTRAVAEIDKADKYNILNIAQSSRDQAALDLGAAERIKTNEEMLLREAIRRRVAAEAGRNSSIRSLISAGYQEYMGTDSAPEEILDGWLENILGSTSPDEAIAAFLNADKVIDTPEGVYKWYDINNDLITAINSITGQVITYKHAGGSVILKTGNLATQLSKSEAHVLTEYIYAGQEVDASSIDTAPLSVDYDHADVHSLFESRSIANLNFVDPYLAITTDEEGSLSTFYRAAGPDSNVEIEADRDGLVRKLYGKDGLIEALVDSRGRTTVFEYEKDSNGNIELVTLNTEGVKRVYDRDANLIKFITADKTVIELEGRRPTSIVRPGGTVISRISTDEAGNIISATLVFADGSVIRIADGSAVSHSLPDGTEAEFEGSMVRRITYPDKTAETYRYQKDDGGNITAIIVDDDLGSRRYNNDFTLGSFTNTKGEAFNYVNNVLSSIEYPGGAVATGLRMDGKGDLVDARMTLADGVALIVEDGSVKRIEAPDGVVTYFGEGRITKVLRPGKGNYFYTYTEDRAVVTEAATGVKRTYDQNSELISALYPDGTLLEFDGGRLKKIAFSDGTLITGVIQDSEGNLTGYSAEDPDGSTRLVSGGLLRKHIDSLGVVADYTYELDQQGAVMALSIEKEDRQWRYSGDLELLSQTAEDGTETKFAAGLVSKVTSGDGRIILEYVYNDRDEIVSINYGDSQKELNVSQERLSLDAQRDIFSHLLDNTSQLELMIRYNELAALNTLVSQVLRKRAEMKEDVTLSAGILEENENSLLAVKALQDESRSFLGALYDRKSGELKARESRLLDELNRLDLVRNILDGNYDERLDKLNKAEEDSLNRLGAEELDAKNSLRQKLVSDRLDIENIYLAELGREEDEQEKAEAAIENDRRFLLALKKMIEDEISLEAHDELDQAKILKSQLDETIEAINGLDLKKARLGAQHRLHVSVYGEEKIEALDALSADYDGALGSLEASYADKRNGLKESYSELRGIILLAETAARQKLEEKRREILAELKATQDERQGLLEDAFNQALAELSEVEAEEKRRIGEIAFKLVELEGNYQKDLEALGLTRDESLSELALRKEEALKAIDDEINGSAGDQTALLAAEESTLKNEFEYVSSKVDSQKEEYEQLKKLIGEEILKAGGSIANYARLKEMLARVNRDLSDLLVHQAAEKAQYEERLGDLERRKEGSLSALKEAGAISGKDILESFNASKDSMLSDFYSEQTAILDKEFSNKEDIDRKRQRFIRERELARDQRSMLIENTFRGTLSGLDGRIAELQARISRIGLQLEVLDSDLKENIDAINVSKEGALGDLALERQDALADLSGSINAQRHTISAAYAGETEKTGNEYDEAIDRVQAQLFGYEELKSTIYGQLAEIDDKALQPALDLIERLRDANAKIGELIGEEGSLLEEKAGHMEALSSGYRAKADELIARQALEEARINGTYDAGRDAVIAAYHSEQEKVFDDKLALQKELEAECRELILRSAELRNSRLTLLEETQAEQAKAVEAGVEVLRQRLAEIAFVYGNIDDDYKKRLDELAASKGSSLADLASNKEEALAGISREYAEEKQYQLSLLDEERLLQEAEYGRAVSNLEDQAREYNLLKEILGAQIAQEEDPQSRAVLGLQDALVQAESALGDLSAELLSLGAQHGDYFDALSARELLVAAFLEEQMEKDVSGIFLTYKTRRDDITNEFRLEQDQILSGKFRDLREAEDERKAVLEGIAQLQARRLTLLDDAYSDQIEELAGRIDGLQDEIALASFDLTITEDEYRKKLAALRASKNSALGSISEKKDSLLAGLELEIARRTLSQKEAFSLEQARIDEEHNLAVERLKAQENEFLNMKAALADELSREVNPNAPPAEALKERLAGVRAELNDLEKERALEDAAYHKQKEDLRVREHQALSTLEGKHTFARASIIDSYQTLKAAVLIQYYSSQNAVYSAKITSQRDIEQTRKELLGRFDALKTEREAIFSQAVLNEIQSATGRIDEVRARLYGISEQLGRLQENAGEYLAALEELEDGVAASIEEKLNAEWKLLIDNLEMLTARREALYDMKHTALSEELAADVSSAEEYDTFFEDLTKELKEGRRAIEAEKEFALQDIARPEGAVRETSGLDLFRVSAGESLLLSDLLGEEFEVLEDYRLSLEEAAGAESGVARLRESIRDKKLIESAPLAGRLYGASSYGVNATLSENSLLAINDLLKNFVYADAEARPALLETLGLSDMALEGSGPALQFNEAQRAITADYRLNNLLSLVGRLFSVIGSAQPAPAGEFSRLIPDKSETYEQVLDENGDVYRILVTDGKGTRAYDKDANLVRFTSSEGVMFDYDDGAIVTVTLADGTVIEDPVLDYTGRITGGTAVLADGTSIELDGSLVKKLEKSDDTIIHTSEDGTVRVEDKKTGAVRSFNSDGTIASETAADGTRRIFSNNLLIEEISPAGARTTYEHLPGGITMVETGGIRRVYSSGELKEQITGEGTTYFANGRIDAVADKNGNIVLEYQYDENGELAYVRYEALRGQVASRFDLARDDIEARFREALSALDLQEGAGEDVILAKEAERLAALEEAIKAERAKVDSQVYQLRLNLIKERHRLEGLKSYFTEREAAFSRADLGDGELEAVYSTGENSQILASILNSLAELEQAEADLEQKRQDGYSEILKQENDLKEQILDDRERALEEFAAYIEASRRKIREDKEGLLGEVAGREDASIYDIELQEEQNLIYYYFKNTMGREPEAEELDSLANSLDSVSVEAVRAAIKALPEYRERYELVQTIIAGVVSRLSSDSSRSGEEIEAIKKYLESQTLHFGSTAALPLQEILAAGGIEVDIEEILEQLILADIENGNITSGTTGELKLSMDSIIKVAHLYGVELAGGNVDYDELAGMDGPVIAYFDSEHYVTVIAVTDSEITYIDPSLGRDNLTVSLGRTEFEEKWSGYIVTSGELSAEDILSRTELEYIKGAGWNPFKAIGKFFSKVWDGVKKIVSKVVDGVKSFFSKYGEMILNTVFPVYGIVKAAIQGDWKSALLQVGMLALNFIPGVGQALQAVGNAILAPIKALAAPIINAVGAVVSGVTQGLKTVWQGIANSAIGQAVGNVVSGVTTAVTNIANTVLAPINSITGNIGIELGAEALVESVKKVALNVAVTKGLEEVGANEEWANIGGALISGSLTDGLETGLGQATYAGIGEIGEHQGWDPMLTNTLGQVAGNTVTYMASNAQGYKDDYLASVEGKIPEAEYNALKNTPAIEFKDLEFNNNLMPGIASSFSSYGITKLAQGSGLDLETSQIMASLGSSIFANDPLENISKDLISINLQKIAQEQGLTATEAAIGSTISAAVTGGLRSSLRGATEGSDEAISTSGFFNGVKLSLSNTVEGLFEPNLSTYQVYSISQSIQDIGLAQTLSDYAISNLHTTSVDQIHDYYVALPDITADVLNRIKQQIEMPEIALEDPGQIPVVPVISPEELKLKLEEIYGYMNEESGETENQSATTDEEEESASDNIPDTPLHSQEPETGITEHDPLLGFLLYNDVLPQGIFAEFLASQEEGPRFVAAPQETFYDEIVRPISDPGYKDIPYYTDKIDYGEDYMHALTIHDGKYGVMEFVNILFNPYLDYAPMSGWKGEAVKNYFVRLGKNTVVALTGKVVGANSAGPEILQDVTSNAYEELASKAMAGTDTRLLAVEKKKLKEIAEKVNEELSGASVIYNHSVKYDNITADDVETSEAQSILGKIAGGVIMGRLTDAATKGHPLAAGAKALLSMAGVLDSTWYKEQSLDSTQRRYDINVEYGSLHAEYPKSHLWLKFKEGQYIDTDGKKKYGIIQATYQKSVRYNARVEWIPIDKIRTHEGDDRGFYDPQ